MSRIPLIHTRQLLAIALGLLMLAAPLILFAGDEDETSGNAQEEAAEKINEEHEQATNGANDTEEKDATEAGTGGTGSAEHAGEEGEDEKSREDDNG